MFGRWDFSFRDGLLTGAMLLSRSVQCASLYNFESLWICTCWSRWKLAPLASFSIHQTCVTNPAVIINQPCIIQQSYIIYRSWIMKSLRFFATAVKKQVRTYSSDLLVEKKQKKNPQKTAEAQPGRRKITIRLQPFFRCGAWVFLGVQTKNTSIVFSVRLEVEIKCNWYVLPVVLWEKLTYSMDVKFKVQL